MQAQMSSFVLDVYKTNCYGGYIIFVLIANFRVFVRQALPCDVVTARKLELTGNFQNWQGYTKKLEN